MNRKQRRAQAKATPSWRRNLSREQMAKGLVQNGISTEDLENAFRDGFNAGFSEASPGVIKTVYAAVVLATRHQLHFGRERCKRLLMEVDQIVTITLDSQEAIEQVYQEIGLIIDFKDPIEPIKEVSEC